MRLKVLSLAVGALLLGASAASAEVVVRDLNLRTGPGPQFPIIGTMPAGAQVGVLGCDGGWCRVQVPSGPQGFASASYLAPDGPPPGPPPGYYPGPPPAVFGIGIPFGGDGWHRRHRHWR